MANRTEDWLDLEYPKPKYSFDRANITKKIQCVMHCYDMFLKDRDKDVLVLDFGCGTGAFSPELGEKGCKIIGIDISGEVVAKAKSFSQNTRGCLGFVVGDAANPPFRNDIFDVIICSEVLEHLNSPGRCLGIIRDLLKDGGLAIITVPWLWDICSNTKQAVGNRMLDHMRSHRKGYLAKLIFARVGDSPGDLVLRKYIPSNYEMYSETIDRTIKLGDLISAHFYGNAEHLGHKHWFTPGEWIEMVEKNGLRVVYWEGNGKIIPYVASQWLDKVLGNILPRKTVNRLSQIVVIVAVK